MQPTTMIPIEPLLIGAAASALPQVIDALPKPGEFVGMLREAITGRESPDTSVSSKTTASDSSFEAEKQQAYGLSSWRQRGLGSLSLEGIFGKLSETVSQFRDSLSRLLEEHGIDRSEKIRLQIDTEGEARLRGSHDDAAEIEAIFKEHPALRNQLAQIDSHASLLHAAGHSAEFRDAYAADPVDAVARFSDWMSDKSPPSATVVIGQNSFDVLFD